MHVNEEQRHCPMMKLAWSYSVFWTFWSRIICLGNKEGNGRMKTRSTLRECHTSMKCVSPDGDDKNRTAHHLPVTLQECYFIFDDIQQEMNVWRNIIARIVDKLFVDNDDYGSKRFCKYKEGWERGWKSIEKLMRNQSCPTNGITT